MAQLKIHRRNQWYGGVRDYKIFLNNRKIGEVGNGDTKEFTIPKGKHELFAQIDWFKTEKIPLELSEYEEKEIVLKSSHKTKLTIPLIAIVTVFIYLSDLRLELLVILFSFLLLGLIYTLTFGKRSFIEFEKC